MAPQCVSTQCLSGETEQTVFPHPHDEDGDDDLSPLLLPVVVDQDSEAGRRAGRQAGRQGRAACSVLSSPLLPSKPGPAFRLPATSAAAASPPPRRRRLSCLFSPAAAAAAAAGCPSPACWAGLSCLSAFCGCCRCRCMPGSLSPLRSSAAVSRSSEILTFSLTHPFSSR